MNTKIEILDSKKLDKNILLNIGDIIKKGGLVAFPTETVYGLGANALDPEAVKKIFIAKGRPQDNPLIVHIADFQEIYELVNEVPHVAKKLMESFWPGAMTIILNKKPIIPDITSAGLMSVGIRMPSSIIAREIIKAAGVPIAAPSANISGKPSPTDVQRCIDDLFGKIQCIVGGEVSEIGLESTIIDCTVVPPCVLRPGGVTLEMLRTIDSDIYIDKAIMEKPKSDLVPKAPGMKYRHYAPKAPVTIVKGDLKKTVAKINEIVQNYIGKGKKVGIMATEETKNQYTAELVISLGTRKDIKSIGKNLFETLRCFDDTDIDVIISEAFDESGFGVAIMNRLNKSAGFNIIDV